MRLSGTQQFSNVYQAKVRASAGPLLVYATTNDLGHPRLGLAVSRRVGSAVVRNTIKRRLREAFRFLQHDWPPPQRGYDVVISVRPHEPLPLSQYQALLIKAVHSLHATWSKKLNKSS